MLGHPFLPGQSSPKEKVEKMGLDASQPLHEDVLYEISE
jgi:hypothetical protein